MLNKKIFTLFIIILLTSFCFGEEKSICVKMDNVGGSCKYPYNFRCIDNKLFAGGNLFCPPNLDNSNEKVKDYIKFLKSLGVKNFIILNVPTNNSAKNSILKKLIQEEGLNYYECSMNAEKVPTQEQTLKIMDLIENKAYVHCMWGADRTGAIIAKYLCLKKGYSGFEAWKAIIQGGSHAGKMGGFKKDPNYQKLVLYFWSNVLKENKEVCKIYNIY